MTRLHSPQRRKARRVGGARQDSPTRKQKLGPPVLELKELFDMRAADWIVNAMSVEDLPATMFEPDSDYAKLHQTDDRAELLKFLKRDVAEWATGGGNVAYRWGKDWAALQAGRLYANSGLQGFPRAIRALLSADYYWDVDCKNCQPTILAQLAHQKGWACAAIDEYVAHREERLKEITDAVVGVDRDKAKESVTAMVFGSGPKVVLRLPDGSEREHQLHAFCRQQLHPEIKKQRKLAWNDDAYAALRKVASARAEDTWGAMNSLFAVVLQTEEAKVLAAIHEAATQQGRELHCLVFDGALMRRLYGEEAVPAELLASLESAIRDKTGYTMELAVKPMECPLAVPDDYVATGIIGAKAARDKQPISDVYAARELCAVVPQGTLVNDNGTVWCFDGTTGLWASGDEQLNRLVTQHAAKLYFGPKADYGGMHHKRKALLALLPSVSKQKGLPESRPPPTESRSPPTAPRPRLSGHRLSLG